MPAKKVRYAQPLLGEANALGYLIAVPGAAVQIRQNGVACSVYADETGTALSNPVPVGVPQGTAGVDTEGTLLVYLTAGSGYDAVATVGTAASTFSIPTISPHVADVADAAGTTAALATKADAAGTTAALATKAGLADSTFETVLNDPALSAGSSSVAVLGELNGDLYAFFASEVQAGTLSGGIYRKRAGSDTWTRIGTAANLSATPVTYNRFAEYGAVNYKGKLYMGDRSIGRFYRLDLHATNVASDGGPAFVAVSLVSTLSSGEDVLPGPVWLNKLVIGSFGNYAGGIPQVYTYDGTTVTSILSLTNIGSGGIVDSVAIIDGYLYVSAMNNQVPAGGNVNKSELWRIDPALNVTLLFSSTTVAYRLLAHNGELLGVEHGNNATPSARCRLMTWRDDTRTWVAVSDTFGGQIQGTQLLAAAVALSEDEILLAHYYDGLFAYTDGMVRAVGDNPTSPTQNSTDLPRLMAVVVHEGYLYAATNQPVGVVRRRLGAGRLVRGAVRPQVQRGGRPTIVPNPSVPPHRVGAFIGPNFASVTTVALSTGGISYAVPVRVQRWTNIDQLAIEVTTAGDATAVVRLGIYADNGAGYPGALVAGTEGTVAAASTGLKTLAITKTLAPGLYWFLAVHQVGATPATLRGGSSPEVPVLGTSFLTSTASAFRDITGAMAAGALPANFSVVENINPTAPAIRARVAA